MDKEVQVLSRTLVWHIGMEISPEPDTEHADMGVLEVPGVKEATDEPHSQRQVRLGPLRDGTEQAESLEMRQPRTSVHQEETLDSYAKLLHLAN